ncbi:MAG: hypothetical protein K0B02_04585 [DPANN group archaeon]|nr:hypothetical protein [DPANN group archaeon]
MKDLKITDDLLSPSKVIKVEGKMNNPVSLIDKAATIYKTVLNIASSGIQNPKFSWSSLDGYFKGRVIGILKFDAWTKLEITIEISGSQDLTTKDGDAMIVIYPTITTKYVYSNPFQIMLWNIYAKMFYHEKRLQYMKESRHFVDRIKGEYLSALGINAM